MHRWIELAKPETCVLTDGSGRTERSRLPSTSRVLMSAGARPGTVFGSFADAEIYDLIRRGSPAPFVEVMAILADRWIAADVDYVVADALEGFNPSHDICRYLVNGAVALVRKHTGRVVANFDFLLDGSPTSCPDDLKSAAVVVNLDDEALARKLAAARGYPELQGETDAALARFGPAAFAVEMLRPVLDVRQGVDAIDPDPPFYEAFGERQVRAGHYDSVIRYRSAVQPLVRAIWHQAGLESAGMTTDTVTSSATGGCR
ncbi:MAG: hypothetical protein ABI634_01820 [Acidobacteriota bacterium]